MCILSGCVCIENLNVCALCLVVGADTGEGWSEYRTKDGHFYYYNGKSDKSQWEKPENFTGTSHELTRDEIQVSNGKKPFKCHPVKLDKC